MKNKLREGKRVGEIRLKDQRQKGGGGSRKKGR